MSRRLSAALTIALLTAASAPAAAIPHGLLPKDEPEPPVQRSGDAEARTIAKAAAKRERRRLAALKSGRAR